MRNKINNFTKVINFIIIEKIEMKRFDNEEFDRIDKLIEEH